MTDSELGGTGQSLARCLLKGILIVTHTLEDIEMRIKDTYNESDIENLNCLAFIVSMAAVVLATVAKVMGVA